MYSEIQIRQLPCYHCVHCIECKDMIRGRFTKRKCDLTKRWGRMDKACYCTKFEDKRKESSPALFNGYRVRKDQIEDYRTTNQWASAGYVIRDGAVGTEMYASRFSAMNDGPRFIYFLPDQVQPR